MIKLQTFPMVFLPVMERELRVAARKRSTAWLRVVAALVALIIGSGFLAMSVTGGLAARSGGALFGTLTWLAFACSLAAGVFFTSDSLSEEKREGTLGFLFLTDLRVYDIVGGKLLATSLRGGYSFLALFPVLAITLIMGGVTGLQFWKSSLALVNSLFCSLTVGLFVSSLCRDSQRAMGGTLLVLVLVCACGPIADSIRAAFGLTGFKSLLSLTSPVYVFWASSAWGKTYFWTGLLATHVIGWVWLGLACLLVPRTWQDRPRRDPRKASFRYSWRYGGAPARATRRRKLIEPNPVLWLALRERWQWTIVWVLVLLVLGPFAAISITFSSMVWIIWAQISRLVLVVFYLWAASQSSCFFIEARKSGLMEVLLVTPLTSRDIVLGQWHALIRLIWLPVLLLLVLQLAGSLFSQRVSMGVSAATGGASAPFFALNLLSGVLGAISVLGNLVAVTWVGMWMGLSSKNASAATLKTLIFVQVLPWVAISIASTTLAGVLLFQRVFTGGTPSASMMFTFPLIMAGLSAVLSLGKDIAFFIWARNRLNSSLRSVAVGRDDELRRPAPRSAAQHTL